VATAQTPGSLEHARRFVGGHVVCTLADAGATLVVSDIDNGKRALAERSVTQIGDVIRILTRSDLGDLVALPGSSLRQVSPAEQRTLPLVT